MNEARMNALLDDAPYLLTRTQAARRYSLAQRIFAEIYRRDPDFPIIRVGKRVMVHREQADAYFTRFIRDEIEVG